MNVSVVIPVFNGLKYLGEALESVYSQTISVHEVICIDDASEECIESYIKDNFSQVKILRNNTNLGPSFSRNKGIEQASGSHIAFLDADDLWMKRKIEWQLCAFKEHRNAKVIGGLAQNFVKKNNIEHIGEKHFNAYMGSMLIEKSVFDQIGLFNTEMRLSEDQDWFLRVREAGIQFNIIDQVVLYKRIHDRNTTGGLRFKHTGFINALKQSLDRRRNNGDLKNMDQIKIMDTNGA